MGRVLSSTPHGDAQNKYKSKGEHCEVIGESNDQLNHCVSK